MTHLTLDDIEVEFNSKLDEILSFIEKFVGLDLEAPNPTEQVATWPPEQLILGPYECKCQPVQLSTSSSVNQDIW